MAPKDKHTPVPENSSPAARWFYCKVQDDTYLEAMIAEEMDDDSGDEVRNDVRATLALRFIIPIMTNKLGGKKDDRGGKEWLYRYVKTKHKPLFRRWVEVSEGFREQASHHLLHSVYRNPGEHGSIWGDAHFTTELGQDVFLSTHVRGSKDKFPRENFVNLLADILRTDLGFEPIVFEELNKLRKRVQHGVAAPHVRAAPISHSVREELHSAQVEADFLLKLEVLEAILKTALFRPARVAEAMRRIKFHATEFYPDNESCVGTMYKISSRLLVQDLKDLVADAVKEKYRQQMRPDGKVSRQTRKAYIEEAKAVLEKLVKQDIRNIANASTARRGRETKTASETNAE